jgi:type 1 glutamine amidotransferase
MAFLATVFLHGAWLRAEVPREDLQRIRTAAPVDAPAEPQRPRKVLVFSRADGYVHDSIPFGAAAIQIIGVKTGAYTAVLSDDPAMFDRNKLGTFDAVVFNNNCGNPVADPVRRQNLLDFVRSGKGLVGIHCAAHLDWPEYTDMLGGYSISHPWNAGSTVTIKLDEPDHPLVRCFCKSSFLHTDEIFEFDHYSREKVRVLLSLDTTRTDMNKPEIRRTDGDFALSWIRNYGQGRVFYSALGPPERRLLAARHSQTLSGGHSVCFGRLGGRCHITPLIETHCSRERPHRIPLWNSAGAITRTPFCRQARVRNFASRFY